MKCDTTTVRWGLGFTSKGLAAKTAVTHTTNMCHKTISNFVASMV